MGTLSKREANKSVEQDEDKRCGGRLRPDERGRTGITRVIIQWLLRKWLLRCEMVKNPEERYQRVELLNKCQEWWADRKNKRLLNVDSYLVQDRHEPNEHQTDDYLREWMRVRENAENAFRRYRPGKDQPNIHRWLVRKEG